MYRIITGVLALVVAGPTFAASVDLSGWQVERSTVGVGTPSWTVGPGGSSVVQSQNGSASIFLDPNGGAQGTRLSTTFQSSVAADDDYSGFVIGMNPGEFSGTAGATDFFLLDWKETTQTYQGTTANAGLALSHVYQAPGSFSQLWGHSTSLVEVARGETFGDTGYSDLTDYAFEIVFTEDLIEVTVDGQTEISYSSADHGSTFSDGGYGFYAFTQPGGSFANVDISPLASPDPTPVPVPAGLPLMLGAMGIFAALRRR